MHEDGLFIKAKIDRKITGKSKRQLAIERYCKFEAKCELKCESRVNGELERLSLQIGDILVVEGNGSISEIGRSAIWKGEIKNCVHQNHLIRIRYFAGVPEYLNFYWNSPICNEKIMKKAASTSGLYTLSVGKIISLPLPLAPYVEQIKVVKEVERGLSQIDAAEKAINDSLQRAARLRQSILKRAFEGKLVNHE